MSMLRRLFSKSGRDEAASDEAPCRPPPGLPVEGGEAPSRLLYARGFLLTRREAPSSLGGWRRTEVGAWHLHSDPRVPMQTASTGTRSVWLLGDAFDPEAGIYADIVRTLVVGDIGRHLDSVAGRFMLFAEEGQVLTVYHDALGSRAVFYGDGVVASHAGLAADVLGTGLREWIIPFITSVGYGKRDVKYLPGLDSPFVGVRQLTPNTRLRLPSGEIERYWPRGPKPETGSAFALEALVAHLRGLGEYVSRSGKAPIAGLTAGRDSRGVMAALVELEPRLFTFVRSPDGRASNSADTRAARQLAAQYALDVEIVRLTAPTRLSEADTPFGVAYRRNTGYVRGLNSPWVEHFAAADNDDSLYVRGFGGEVMRGFYRKGTRMSASQLAKTYDLNAGSRYTREAFDTFMRIAQWNDAAFFDYALDDMLYWEHRMGVWGASALGESDMAFRSLNGYSSRNLFAAFMALPAQQRDTSALFAEATAGIAPKLAGIPYPS